jgi:hypothetical protein
MSSQLSQRREKGACATFVEEVGQFCISTEFQNLCEYFDILPSPVSSLYIVACIMCFSLSSIQFMSWNSYHCSVV